MRERTCNFLGNVSVTDYFLQLQMKGIIIGVSVSVSLFLLITVASIIFIIIIIVIATRKKRRPIHRGIIKEVDMKSDDNNDEVGSDEKAIIVNDS